ncbi:hypothetical protein VPH35_048761 [Triticum aestivum]
MAVVGACDVGMLQSWCSCTGTGRSKRENGGHAAIPAVVRRGKASDSALVLSDMNSVNVAFVIPGSTGPSKHVVIELAALLDAAGRLAITRVAREAGGGRRLVESDMRRGVVKKLLQCTMTIIDFIDVIDDIIDLSSDEENVEQDEIPTQPLEMMLDTQEVFVEAGDGRQEAAESGNTIQATTLSMFKEKGPLDTTANQNCTSMTVPLPSPASAAPEAHPSSQPDQTEEGSSTQSRDTTTGTTATPSLVVEEGPLDTTATKNFPPTSVPFRSPTFTTPKGLTYEGDNGRLLRMYERRPRKKKNYHNETPRRNPRFEDKHKCNKRLL